MCLSLEIKYSGGVKINKRGKVLLLVNLFSVDSIRRKFTTLKILCEDLPKSSLEQISISSWKPNEKCSKVAPFGQSVM